MGNSTNQISIIDSTLFELIDIDQFEEVNHLNNMYDITVEDDESFIFADGIVSHNSAISMALSVRDPKTQGFYSLRGKILNTHGMSEIEIVKNKELSELLTIIGLDLNSQDIDYKELSYGKIAGLQDMDHDGHAIFCLLLLFFSRWPKLFEEGRILRVISPLFVCKKKGRVTKYYYSFEEYENAKNTLSGYEVSYIKGLGSLDKEDYAETVTRNPRMIQVTIDDIKKLDMAFGDDANLRKDWMIQ